MSDSHYNQGEPRHGSTAGYAPYSSTEQGYYPPPPQNNYGAYRPEDEGYRDSRRASNMQVGPAYDGSYYDDEPSQRHHHHHHRRESRDYDDRSRSHSRRRSRSRSASAAHRGSVGGEKKEKAVHHKGEKKLAATVAGGVVSAFAAHELGHGHHDIATVVAGLAGAYAGNQLEKKHEKKKEDKLRRESESEDSYYSGSGPQYGSRDLVRDDNGRRGSRRDSRRDEYSDDESDGDYRRRHHH